MGRDFTGFSYTWWGKGLLFGLPFMYVCYEFLSIFVFASWRVSKNLPDQALAKGEHLLINKRAYSHTSNKSRNPGKGDLVIYSQNINDSWALGKINGVYRKNVDGEPQDRYALIPLCEDSKPVDVPLEKIIGKAICVWWPIWRARNINILEVTDEE